MERRKYFKLITEIAEEASIKLPLEEIENTDNSELIRFSKFQLFLAKSKLFKELGSEKLEEAKSKIKSELQLLAALPLATLQERLIHLIPQTQFRNLDKLDKDEILKLIEDSLILENLSDDEV